MSNKSDVRVALISLFNLDFGVRYISSFLKDNGYATYVILFNKQRYSVEFLGNDYFNPSVIRHHICPPKDIDLLISLLKRLDVRLVGISVSSTFMRTAQAITREIKKHLDVLVVWGGIHPIIAPQECTEDADIVCIGEGEFPMLELAEKIRNNQSISGIKNLWIKTNNGIEKNEMRLLIENLDELPFPDFVERDNKFLIDSGKLAEDPPIISSYQGGVYPIMSSRGCMNSCAFCCNSVLRRRYKGKGMYLRRRSVDNVIAEIKYAVENRSFHVVRFWDDIFTYDRKWIDRFCVQYIKHVGKPFACYTHPRHTDKDILIKLKYAGLTLANLGIQSGSEKVSELLFSRKQSNQDIIDFANFVKKLKITARYDLISDNPYETDENQVKTVELLLRLSYPFQMQLYSLCWFPETPLTKRALADNVITPAALEQYTSKALNNFHVYLPLSKSKRGLFWNCIKAMAINRGFPKYLVKFCIKSNFFKKYPHILFLLARNYLRLFTKFTVKWRGYRFVFIKKIPMNRDHLVRYYDSDKISWSFIVGRAKLLFFKAQIEYSFFPLQNKKETKMFCLRIRHRLRRGKLLSLFMNLIPLDISDKSNNKSIWFMEFHIGYDYQTDVYFSLSYPELMYSINNYQYKAKLIKAQRPPFLKRGIYKVRLKYADRSNSFIGDILLEI